MGATIGTAPEARLKQRGLSPSRAGSLPLRSCIRSLKRRSLPAYYALKFGLAVAVALLLLWP